LRSRFEPIVAADNATPGVYPPGAPRAETPGSRPIFTALENQLGLKLEPARGLQDFLVVDHAEKP
jgi:uncharacterized protein (TIGR03435 family)